MKLRNKKLSVVLAILLAVAMGSNVANAATYGTPVSGTYNIVSNQKSGNYTHHIYKNSSNWCRFYGNKKLVVPTYHTKNSGKLTLSVNYAQSASTTNTVNWSSNQNVTSSMGANSYVFSTSVNLTSGIGYGKTKASGYSYKVGFSISQEIPSDAESGYYSAAPGHTYYEMRDIVIGDNGSSNTIYYMMPYGDSVIYILYSKDNSTYKIY